MPERENRVAMKSLVRCTHFLTRHHIAHSTNFTQLVYLNVSCVAREENCKFSLKMPQGMQYTLLEQQWLTLLKHLELGLRSLLKKLQRASIFCSMADECTIIMAVEELSIFCHWEEDGTPVEYLLDIVPGKKMLRTYI